MLNFQHISLETFLNEYWQKKPLIIRNALIDFVNPISPDELAGLALEEEVESRLVRETPLHKPYWHLKRGPLLAEDFNKLPQTHWTLLVQGADRLIPEVYALLNYFDFLPQWRIDDVMISFAAMHGSVGPHYDNYDVFLYQAKGRREWFLTTRGCHQENYINNLELRIMKQFITEENFILEEGDMLYLPPHIGHHGVSLSEECMTYSFGYRSYQGQELWDSLGDYLSEKELFTALYKDPNWSHLQKTSELTQPAWQSAQQLLQQLITDEKIMKSWFGCFATRLDLQAEQQMPLPMDDSELVDMPTFIHELQQGANLFREFSCRFAYQINEGMDFQFFLNGCEWTIEGVSHDLLSYLANNRFLSSHFLDSYLDNPQNRSFLYELWKLQWLQIEEN